jgi:hypothetical protein
VTQSVSCNVCFQLSSCSSLYPYGLLKRNLFVL